MSSLFDVMGPIIIGPSSSHTAGAAKLGRLARLIFDEKIEEAEIGLHGSFASTGKGHGTDKALVGGLLGFKPDDPRIRESLKLADDNGVKINFSNIKLPDAHPNSVKITMKNDANSLTVIGSSVGGGNVKVTKIEDYKVNITGSLPTIWLIHQDKPGMVGLITSILGSYNLNIAFMQDFRKIKGTVASAIIELDQEVSKYTLNHLKNTNNIEKVRYIPAL
ncbi:L-serine ammonia-lyase, iron-sulfur-dependent, subunit beta [Halanaerobiaceae bacterium Z-7014]|uniref:L-serine deaminase n=1 Tax=Halonatronomonas betaini TaxID=2778430 RepID=A0A931F984_9FIRM|nr:L-serine ammonia-lyase, iron-sulfur-dependent subunit beta [Halonatronomonas betaini]MBF8435732.1 L-serine ammonia-lyase, iron-sulfur-dependent, subunit beta [Halonatronomonas betaini]